MTAIAAQNNPRAEMQPMFLALLGRVNEIVRGNVAPALSTPRGVAASFLAYVELWRLLRAALMPEAAEPKPGQPHSVLEVLLGWFAPSPALLAELRAAENTAVRPLFPLRSGMRSAGLQLRAEDLPALPPTDRELCEHVSRLGLPALADYLGSPSHAGHLVRLFAVLLQGEWQHSGINLNVTWPRLPEPFADDGARLLLELLDEREPTGRMRRPASALKPGPSLAPPGAGAHSISPQPTAASPKPVAPPPQPRAASTAILSVASSRPPRPPAAFAPSEPAPAQTVSGPVPKAAPRPAAQAWAEEVRFTVYRPRTVKPAQWAPLLAFAHRAERASHAPPGSPDPTDGAASQAQAILGPELGAYRQLEEDAARSVPIEGCLDFVPDVPGIEFDPPHASCRWTGEVHRAEFRMRAPAELAGQMVHGQLRVQFGSILLAEVALSLKVAGAAGMEHAGIVTDSARMYRKIFASYSQQDWAIAEQLRELAKTLGDRYLIDVSELRAGERWSSALQRVIAEADVFQLFWSWNSLHSPFVRREWEYALSLERPNFLRATYWEMPLPEPPDELRELRFQRLRPLPAGATSTAPSALPPASVAPLDEPNGGLGSLLMFGGLAASAVLAIQLVLSPGEPSQPKPPAPAVSQPPSAAAVSSQPAEATPIAGQPIEIQSQPAGAEVYLLGTRIGVTPLRLTPSATAALEGLELRLSGYTPKPVDLREARDRVLRVELSAEPASDPRAIEIELQRLRKELAAVHQKFGENDPRARQLRTRIEALKQRRASSGSKTAR